ncbi:hypothetical protein H5T58_02515, partial [Candidatus Parcubacteria bacterium]|nr:hypothetical protein [Candidatus Parcubacteria bacterium]
MREALTKIVATIGPASEKKEIIEQMARGGVDVFRLNLKHSSLNWHFKVIKKIREVSFEIKKPVPILVDVPEQLKFRKNFLFSLVDYIAVSFTQSKRDIEKFRKIVPDWVKIVAKIEDRNGIKNFNSILASADGIMIARGDLAKQIPFEKLPYYQKTFIKKATEEGKPTIVATEMLKSMVESKFPTRAEISDIANAILDYADALMLSEETAIGKYPVLSVKMMEKICLFWEKKRDLPFNFDFKVNTQPAAVAFSAWQLWIKCFQKKFAVKAFLVLTKTGTMARMLSRLKPKIPILALTNDKKIQHQLSLYFGVYPFLTKERLYQKRGPQEIRKLLNLAKKNFNLKTQDRI